MKLMIRSMAGEDDVLSGAVAGQAMFAKMISNIAKEPPQESPLFLDFSGIELATASFLRQGVIAFRDHLRARGSKWFPIVANAADPVVEELAYLLDLAGDAMLICTLDASGNPKNAEAVGRLERGQQLTLTEVLRRGETGAVDLSEAFPDDGVKTTAWNNRLAALAARGLVIEFSRGRLKRYRPVLTEA